MKLKLFQVLFFALTTGAILPVELKIDADNTCQGNCARMGCCKLKYPSGGYDFVMTSEENCRNSRYFHMFSDKNDSLCFEWKDDLAPGSR